MSSEAFWNIKEVTDGFDEASGVALSYGAGLGGGFCGIDVQCNPGVISSPCCRKVVIQGGSVKLTGGITVVGSFEKWMA